MRAPARPAGAGARFEPLALRTERTFRARFRKVRLRSDWPGRDGPGNWCDIVAERHDEGAPGFAIPAGRDREPGAPGLGDAVCVPAAEWAARRCLAPVFGARPPSAPDGGAPALPAA